MVPTVVAHYGGKANLGGGKPWERKQVNHNGKPVKIAMHVKKGDIVQVGAAWSPVVMSAGLEAAAGVRSSSSKEQCGYQWWCQLMGSSSRQLQCVRLPVCCNGSCQLQSCCRHQATLSTPLSTSCLICARISHYETCLLLTHQVLVLCVCR